MSPRKRTTKSKGGNDPEAEVVQTPITRSKARARTGTNSSRKRKEESEDEDTTVSDNEQEQCNKNTQPKHEEKIHYEFGGPVGAFGVILGTPAVMYALFFLCNANMCMSNPLAFDWTAFWQQIKFENFFSTEASIMYLGWLAFNVFLERILPGEQVEGTVLPGTNGTRLKYTMSGHLQFWLCILAMGHSYPLLSGTGTDGASDHWWAEVYQIQGFAPLRIDLIYDNYLQLISISLVSTALFSLYL